LLRKYLGVEPRQVVNLDIRAGEKSIFWIREINEPEISEQEGRCQIFDFRC
jgi:hypothetical protein